MRYGSWHLKYQMVVNNALLHWNIKGLLVFWKRRIQRRISQSYLNWSSRSFLWLFRHGSRVSTNFGHLSASFFSCERRHENNILIDVICCAIYTFDWSLIKRPLRCFSSMSLKDFLQVYACPVKETEEKIQDYPQAELPQEAECKSISFSV